MRTLSDSTAAMAWPQPPVVVWYWFWRQVWKTSLLSTTTSYALMVALEPTRMPLP
jgi:hypothetical protein